MSVVRVQVRMPRDNGLPRDDVVNVWHFKGSADADAIAESAANRLVAFYNALEVWFSRLLTGVINIKAYDLADAEPRNPVFESSDNFQPPNEFPLPSELCTRVNFIGDNPGGVPIRNRRGGVFLGPLSRQTLTGVAGGAGPDDVINWGFPLEIGAALQTLAPEPLAGLGRLAVYSPTRDAGASLEDSTFVVHQVWTDNAFDVQRRRGAKATGRNTFAV